jgi:APA family basic amino acid/polyamine antiporter
LGIIPIIFGLSITVITNMVQLFISFFAFLNFVAYIKMPKRYPEAWKKARFHVHDGVYYAICVISLMGFIVVFWKSCLSMRPVLAVVNVAVLLVMAGIGIWRAKVGNVEIHTSVWAED